MYQNLRITQMCSEDLLTDTPSHYRVRLIAGISSLDGKPKVNGTDGKMALLRPHPPRCMTKPLIGGSNLNTPRKAEAFPRLAYCIIRLDGK